jgi:hypothetical protein
VGLVSVLHAEEGLRVGSVAAEQGRADVWCADHLPSARLVYVIGSRVLLLRHYDDFSRCLDFTIQAESIVAHRYPWENAKRPKARIRAVPIKKSCSHAQAREQDSVKKDSLALLHDRTPLFRFSRTNYAVILLIDLNRISIYLNIDVVLFSRIGWYSPRVPAGETSSILETAALDDFTLGVLDGEIGF